MSLCTMFKGTSAKTSAASLSSSQNCIVLFGKIDQEIGIPDSYLRRIYLIPSVCSNSNSTNSFKIIVP